MTSLAADLKMVAPTAIEDWHGLRSTAEDLKVAVAKVAATVNSPTLMR